MIEQLAIEWIWPNVCVLISVFVVLLVGFLLFAALFIILLEWLSRR